MVFRLMDVHGTRAYGSAISAGTGLTVTADYLAEEFLKENRLKMIWKGNIPTENTLFLVYDKTKVTSDQIKLAQMLFKS